MLACAVVVLAIDQSTKAWVTDHLAPGETVTPIPALADYFSITRSANTGAAFSFLPQAGDLFLIIAIIMSVAILVFYRRLPAGYWLERIALGLLLGGVLGNALDRVRLHYVVDFVHLQLRGVISNVSNLADHAIVVSILILFIAQWIRPKTDDVPGAENTAEKNAKS
jgi:signal peptidase II